ncbi:MAG: 5-(carboxyamino)imidazole ribonucleotide synthase [Thermaerobacter sp.]|nr:5-(carboxyamino)imidazole ribonucleotide synthase [Thermaerobacter sp.]
MRIDPGAWIGILGGGQLGRMMVLAAKRMGYRTVVLDPAADCPAAQVSDQHVAARFDESSAVQDFAQRADVVTYEFENIAVATVNQARQFTPVFPNARLLDVSQNRLREKGACRELGLATARYQAVSTAEEVRRGLTMTGTPAVLKTAEGGYDGKGQVVVRSEHDADAAVAALGRPGRSLILEEWIHFDREVSAIVARGQGGETMAFPIGENVHRNGILHTTTVPVQLPAQVAAAIIGAVEQLAGTLDLVGVMAVEFFIVGERVLVNEIAPRPHNSGHYTIEACSTSQFEQHIRAICGLPLGSVDLLAPAAMVNLMGDDWQSAGGTPNYAQALAVPGSHLHIYGKDDPRTGRKMGHITVLAKTRELAHERALTAWQAFSGRKPGKGADAGF